MHKSLIALTLASSGFAASQNCTSDPVPCNRDTCAPCFCVGPADIIANAAVNPRTCDGDFHLEASLLFWKANQDGMEYAVETIGSFDLLNLVNLIDGEYKSPTFKSNWGLRIGVGYNSPCDGWDLGLVWTHYKGKASSRDSVGLDLGKEEGRSLLPIWTAFHGLVETTYGQGTSLTSEISSQWNGALNLLDLSLGRQYWTSHYLSLRPNIGLRAAKLDQRFELLQSGSGSFGEYTVIVQPPFNDEIKIDNDFEGIGPKLGFDLNWNFGCGWSVYNALAASILYGRFSVDHEETVREAEAPFSKFDVLDTKEGFRAARAVLDISLGLQYAALICDCKYGITTRLSWEQHLFFHQNQMWRVMRTTRGFPQSFRNDSGENTFEQRRGTLSTGGLTFTFGFDF